MSKNNKRDDNLNPLTHNDMKNHMLSGDEINVTTRGDQEDYEIDRIPGDSGGLKDSLVDLPTGAYKIQE